MSVCPNCPSLIDYNNMRGKPSSTENVVGVVSKSVVRIIAGEAMGSGMIVDENGYILANSLKMVVK